MRKAKRLINSRLKTQTKTQICVRRLNDRATRGWLDYGNFRFPCALGRSGIMVGKREGDGATPWGRYAIQRAMFNPAKTTRPMTALPVQRIATTDGWCDAPEDRNYNRPVRHPYPMSAELLCRTDHLYDVVVVLDYNLVPRVRGRGSAVFMHVAKSDYAPTEGCVALKASDLRRLLARLPRDAILITENSATCLRLKKLSRANYQEQGTSRPTHLSNQRRPMRGCRWAT